jgi:hypothetical protein
MILTASMSIIYPVFEQYNKFVTTHVVRLKVFRLKTEGKTAFSLNNLSSYIYLRLSLRNE